MFEEAVSLLSIWASINSWLTPTVLFLLLNLMIGTIAVTTAFTTSHKHKHNHHHHHLTHSPSVLQRLRSLNFYSHLHSPEQHLHHQSPPPPVVDGFPLLPPPTTTSPSVLQRLKSFNIYSYIHSPQQPPPLVPVINDSYYNSNTDLSPQDDDAAAEEEEVVDGFPLPPLPQRQLPPPVINDNYYNSNTDTDLSPEDEVTDEGPTLDEVYNLIVQNGNSAAYGRQNSDTKPTAGEIPIRLPRKMKKSASDKSAFNHFEAVPEVDDNAAPVAVTVAVERETAAAGVDERADDFINKFRQQLKMQRMDSIVRYKETITRGSAK